MSVEKIKEKFNTLTLESEDHWDYRGNSKSERDYVHGFCTYPAMMVPKMQREILDVCVSQIDNEKPVLLDPFAGSGTILVEGMLKGLNVVGIDINPLAVLLCKVKTTIILPNTLDEATVKLKANIDIILEKGHKNHEFESIDKWFTEEAISDLSILRESILLENQIEIRRFFWATFCEVVRIVSNSRDCTYKLHIKEKNDIDNYDKKAIDIFKKTLDFNVNKYKSFYQTLSENGYIKRGGAGYRGNVKIALADSIQYLNHTHQKFDLILTSPPYGDNHTTVSYGQYSVMPLRWINCDDIDTNFNDEIIKTLNGIDSASLGGRSSERTMSVARKKVLEKSNVLKTNKETIEKLAENQVNKLVAFYSDYDKFLSAISKKMKPGAVSVWTLGNRKIAKKEIPMDQIMEELCAHYNLKLVTSFSRKILNKRMPEINAYTGEDKTSQTTMTREHILVFEKEENLDV
ncbi:MAG: hypothetical protein IJ643_02065 [Eubacterium sp.]|nr:hypothetical protein [Eubacterium sp.]